MRECKGAIKQQDAPAGNSPKEEKRKELSTGESVLKYTKNMPL